MSQILKSLDKLGEALAVNEETSLSRFVCLTKKLADLPSNDRSRGVCGTETWGMLTDPDCTENTLNPSILESLPIYLKRLEHKVDFIAAGGDPGEFRLRKRWKVTGKPRTREITPEVAIKVLFDNLMAQVTKLSTRNMLSNIPITDDEQKTLTLLRALIARFPHLDETGD